MSDKKKTPEHKPAPAIKYPVEPGSKVMAKIDGKERGPFYYVSNDGEDAQLQGKELVTVPVKDLSPFTSKPKTKAGKA
jgi:hypothetical protein